MTDPTSNTLSAEILLTGPADQIVAAKTAILRFAQDYPGLTLSGEMHIRISVTEHIGLNPLEQMTIEELLGYSENPRGRNNGYVERARNILRRRQIDTVGQLVEMTEGDLLGIPNFGQRSLDLVEDKLAAQDLRLKA